MYWGGRKKRRKRKREREEEKRGGDNFTGVLPYKALISL
jgi:hypothetical protein